MNIYTGALIMNIYKGARNHILIIKASTLGPHRSLLLPQGIYSLSGGHREPFELLSVLGILYVGNSLDQEACTNGCNIQTIMQDVPCGRWRKEFNTPRTAENVSSICLQDYFMNSAHFCVTLNPTYLILSTPAHHKAFQSWILNLGVSDSV